MLVRCKTEPAVKALGGCMISVATTRPFLAARLTRSLSGVVASPFLLVTKATLLPLGRVMPPPCSAASPAASLKVSEALCTEPAGEAVSTMRHCSPPLSRPARSEARSARAAREGKTSQAARPKTTGEVHFDAHASRDTGDRRRITLFERKTSTPNTDNQICYRCSRISY